MNINYLNLRNSIIGFATICLSTMNFAQDSRGGACWFGFNENSTDFNEAQNLQANILSGTRHQVSTMTVTHLCMKGNGSNSGVQMALYSDNDGVPGDYLGNTGIHNVQSGDMYLALNSPVFLASGFYWICANYENSGGHVNKNNALQTEIYSVPFVFNAGFPVTFGFFNTPQVSTDGHLKYWAASAFTYDNSFINCGPLEYNGQTFTESTTQTFTSVNDCYEIENVTITILPELDNSVSQSGNTLTANLLDSEYQWVDCNMNNQHIPNEMGQSFTPEVSGNYAVILITDLCVDVSACVEVIIPVTEPGVGIENYEDYTFSIAPNPVNDLLSVSVNDLSRIQILTMDGKLIHEFPEALEHTLDLSNLPQGIYFVGVKNKMLRFIKN